jgi:hypothetical protein
LAEASRKSHLDAVPAAAISIAGGEWILRLNDIKGIECRAKLPDSFVGGPELAAEHSAADEAALAAQLMDEVAAEKERRAKHEAKLGRDPKAAPTVQRRLVQQEKRGPGRPDMRCRGSARWRGDPPLE